MDSHLVINERCHGEQVKDAAAVAPGVAVPVFVLTLVIEAVHLRDLPQLVVPSQQGYPVWPPGLEYHEAGECLQAVVSPVHKVPHEDVVGVRYGASSPEEFLEPGCSLLINTNIAIRLLLCIYYVPGTVCLSKKYRYLFKRVQL